MTAAVVLAAGASTRLGEPKQLILLAGEKLLERAVRTAREAGCDPIVVVLGASADRIDEACNLGNAVVLVNDLWAEGMASSIRMGITAVRDCPSAILMTCDQPAASAFHLRALMASGETTASSYADRRGVPAFFPQAAFPGLMQLQGDAGARTLLQHAPAIPLPGGELDLDTPDDVAHARKLFV